MDQLQKITPELLLLLLLLSFHFFGGNFPCVILLFWVILEKECTIFSGDFFSSRTT